MFFKSKRRMRAPGSGRAVPRRLEGQDGRLPTRPVKAFKAGAAARL